MTNPTFKFFNKNQLGRDFVVGDLHGMFSTLEVFLDKLKFNPTIDRVFSVGDLIDRGPESYRVLEFLDKPWFFSVRGNHEMMLINSENDKGVYQSWVKNNGGSWWKDIDPITQKKIRERINKLPITFEVTCDTGQVGIVHADVPVGLSWKDIIKNIHSDKDVQDYVMWSRNRYKYIQTTNETIAVEGIELIVVGHTTVAKPLHIENLYYIDTGATFLQNDDLGYLTLLQIHPTIEVHQHPEPLQ